MNKKTVLVTGGSGFIGGAVCRALVDQGHEVVNLDRVQREIPGTRMVQLDVGSRQLDGIMKLIRPDAVIHLAADHEVRRSVTEPEVFYHNNVSNTIHLLKTCIDNGVGQFIYSSTCAVYGDLGQGIATEDTPINPVSPYGRSKAMVEHILTDLAVAHDIEFVSLRYFNAAGAMPDLSHGYTQDPASHLIPILARNVIDGVETPVYGDDFKTTDGTCERDYAHIMDIARAHVNALTYLEDGGVSQVFNIGSGGSSSVLEVIRSFQEVTGFNVPYNVVEQRAGDPGRIHADISKAKKYLGWEPQYTLDDIVRDAYQWEIKTHRKK